MKAHKFAFWLYFVWEVTRLPYRHLELVINHKRDRIQNLGGKRITVEIKNQKFLNRGLNIEAQMQITVEQEVFIREGNSLFSLEMETRLSKHLHWGLQMPNVRIAKKIAIELQCNSTCRIALQLNCKNKNTILFLVSHLPLSVTRLSLRLLISDSLFPFSPHSLPLFRLKTPQPPHHGLTHYYRPWQATTQCGGIEISIQGLAQRSVFGCGIKIGIGLWVCRGFSLGLSWVAWKWV